MLVADPFRMLPGERGVLLGRSAVVESALEAFRDGVRLVAFTGPGGIGKTSLALHVGHQIDQGWWIEPVDLSAATDEPTMLRIVADALGVRLDHAACSRQLAQLVDSLDARGEGLLLLDNLEQLGEAPVALLSAVLTRARGLRLATTSRHRLSITGGITFELPALDLEAASQLLQGCARSAGRPLAGGDRETVHEIVALLDGLPAAIQMAASRLDIMTPMELRRQLEQDRLAVPMGGVIDRSWRLLSRAQQMVLTQCAVFRGGFTLAAVEQVVGKDSVSIIEELRRQSLLTLRVVGTQSRLAVLQCIAAYALARADEHELGRMRSRHATVYSEWALRRGIDVAGPSTRAAIEALAMERDNLVAAFEHLQDHDPVLAARTALVFDRYLAVRGTPAQHVDLMRRVVDIVRDAAPQHHGEALLALGCALRRAGRYDEAAVQLEDALRSASRGAGRVRARALQTLGRLAMIGGRQEDARACFRRGQKLARRHDDSVALSRIARDRADLRGDVQLAASAVTAARALGDPAEEAFAEWVLGRACRGEERFTEAECHLEHSLELARISGDRYLEALITASTARVFHHAGKLVEAIETYRIALAMHRRAGNATMGDWVQFELGAAQLEAGRHRAAADSLAEALRLARQDGAARTELYALAHLALLRRGPAPEGRRMLEAVACRGAAHPCRAVRAIATLAHEVATSSRIDDAVVARALSDCRRGSDWDIAPIVFARVAARDVGATDAVAAPSLRASAELVVDRRGRFRTRSGRWNELGPTSPLFRILLALAHAQENHPGSAKSVQELIDAGWPEERMVARSGRNRLRNAIARLRGAGLKQVLLTRSDGYQLAPSAIVRFPPEGPTGLEI